MKEKNIEIYIGDEGPFWILESTLENREGPVMPEPDHYLTFGDSYAHITSDGRIMRYRQQIGTWDDVRVIRETGRE